MTTTILTSDNKSPIIEDIRKKIFEKEENCLVVIVGKVRTGKSLCCITFCQHVAPGFSLKEHCCFEMEDFYKILNKKETNKCAIMVEEMGLKADKRSFMTLQNKIISYTFQTFGYKCILLVMTVPSMAFIDSRIEHLINYVFETHDTVKKGGKLISVRFKVKRYQHNPVLGKTYKKRPEFYVNGRKVIVPYITFHAPSEETIAEYKGISLPYKDKINIEIQDDLEISTAKAVAKKKKDKGETIGKTDDDIVDEIITNKDDYTNMWKGKEHIAAMRIMSKFNISEPRATRIKYKVDDRLKQYIDRQPV